MNPFDEAFEKYIAQVTPEEREQIRRAWQDYEAQWAAWWAEARRRWHASDGEAIA